jgi:hypothetical protein
VISRPNVSLWLGSSYALPAGMYMQLLLLRTRFMRSTIPARTQIPSDLKVRHVNFLKGTLVLSVPPQIGLS